MKSSLEVEFGSFLIDIIPCEEYDFKRSKEYAAVDRHISKKITSVPKKKRIPVVNPEEIVSFNICHLRDNLYVSDGTDLVLKSEGKKTYCIGLYNRETKEIVPLTLEKRKYCELIEMEFR
jgi:hypothetical protein